MISRLSLAAGGVVGLIFGMLLFHLINIAVWRPAAVNEGREIERSAILKQAMRNIEQRGKTNAEIRVLDTGALCRELGGRWVPEQNICE
ncbi:hypothetical protein ASE23_01990 [Rhizobium sp. Root73]|uniref:hypothetical protein n=1 Tax=unclassified Rhizobium TaxID=2613769 RepID=UPI000727F158|nr:MULTISPECIES: hypothetical protein [unclassified Rhizobium]KQY17452.1 hypothetical protein ASD36_01990 [Rhizobium sp. Root1334]KRC13332.1 hypothetical protein ASE23_01990 [Rhizobium sp. Root73]